MSSELWIIRAEIFSSQTSLKKLKDLWYRAKKILSKVSELSDDDIDNSLFIFTKGIDRVGDFFAKWLDGKIQPTDEELDLLEEGFNEASWAFDFLAANSHLSSEANQKWQNEIKKSKKIVSEEKDKRESIKNLQDQINSLRNQSDNSDKETRIKDLERQIAELKNQPSPPNPNGPQIPQPPTSPSSTGNNNSLLIGICLSLGVLLILVISFFLFKKRGA